MDLVQNNVLGDGENDDGLAFLQQHREALLRLHYELEKEGAKLKNEIATNNLHRAFTLYRGLLFTLVTDVIMLSPSTIFDYYHVFMRLLIVLYLFTTAILCFAYEWESQWEPLQFTGFLATSVIAADMVLVLIEFGSYYFFGNMLVWYQRSWIARNTSFILPDSFWLFTMIYCSVGCWCLYNAYEWFKTFTAWKKIQYEPRPLLHQDVMDNDDDAISEASSSDSLTQ